MGFVKPEEYGAGLGGSKPSPEPDPIGINFAQTGLRLDVGPEDLAEGESPALLNIQSEFGAIGPAYDRTALGGAVVSTESQKVMAIVPFELQKGLKLAVRMRPTMWDYWDGGTWRELAGPVAGHVNARWQSVIMEDMLVGANGVGQLVAWDGSPITGPVPLSADAPIAQFITRIGNRIVAVKIRPSAGADFDPYLLAWCADGDIHDWTQVNFGAGAGVLGPAGSSESAQFFTGVSCLERGVVIYRQRSLVLMSLTGVGIAPFRFTTIDFAHGTESPYSIANGGLTVGDFFLGEDYIVYNFDGVNPPVPVGLPIERELRNVLTDLRTAVGTMDTKNQRYHLYVATGDDPQLLDRHYTFDIKKYVTQKRLEWVVEQLAPGEEVTGAGFGQEVPFGVDPVINTVNLIVNTVNVIVNSYLDVPSEDLVLLGDANGKTYFLDKDNPRQGGYIVLRPIAMSDADVTVNYGRITYQADANATVGISVSFDGGRTFSDEQVMSLGATGPGQMSAKEWLYQTGHWPFIRIRFLSGLCRVFKVYVGLVPRGRSVS